MGNGPNLIQPTSQSLHDLARLGYWLSVSLPTGPGRRIPQLGPHIRSNLLLIYVSAGTGTKAVMCQQRIRAGDVNQKHAALLYQEAGRRLTHWHGWHGGGIFTSCHALAYPIDDLAVPV